MHKFIIISLIYSGLFATTPSSTNYNLRVYDLGTGGGGNATSTNFGLEGQAGSQAGDPATSTNFNLNPGLIPTQNAFVPPAPTLTNPSSEYSRLHLVLNNGNNPSDTLFAIAISDDNFITTRYIKSDTAIGDNLVLGDYKSYASWGGASGFWITGLESSTSYKVKVKALQGDYSESTYGPTSSSVATVLPQISFSVSTSLSPTPPFNTAFSGLVPGVVVTSDANILLDLSTNSVFGGYLAVKSSNAGLNSSSESYNLASATIDLASATGGYGARVSSTSQSSGGPMAALSPYNGASDNVGGLTTVLTNIGSSSTAVTSGNITVQLKAKASGAVPAATDYSDSLTFVAGMLF